MARSINVLIVEDDDIARLLETSIVKEHAVEVDSVGTSTEALDLIKKKPYDLILLDIGLPDRDGIELTQLIRASDSSNKKAPIIALTTHTDKDYKDMAFSFGMNSYIVKPLTEEKLQTAVKELAIKL